MPHVLRADGTFARPESDLEERLARDLDRVRSFESIEQININGGGIYGNTYYYTIVFDTRRGAVKVPEVRKKHSTVVATNSLTLFNGIRYIDVIQISRSSTTL